MLLIGSVVGPLIAGPLSDRIGGPWLALALGAMGLQPLGFVTVFRIMALTYLLAGLCVVLMREPVPAAVRR